MYYKSGQESMVVKFISLMGETTAIILLNGCDVPIKLLSKHLH